MAIQLVLPIMLAFVTIREAYAQMPSIALPECPEKCGNISISYPFGIEAKCSANDYFTITCNDSYTPSRPFLADTSMEVLNISLYFGYIRVSNPFIQNLRSPRFIPPKDQTRFTTDIDWYEYLKCDARFPTTNNISFISCGNNTVCLDDGWCDCKHGYVGNPYTPAGCQDFDECSVPNVNGTVRYYSYDTYGGSFSLCSQGCTNQLGGYSCYCASGYKLAGDGHWCYPDNKTRTAIIGHSQTLPIICG